MLGAKTTEGQSRIPNSHGGDARITSAFYHTMAIANRRESSSALRASSLLSDIPRRMLTICIGVPILWLILSFSATRHLFFQGAHVVMCWEWCNLSKMQGLSRHMFVISSLALANISNDGRFLQILLFAVAVFPFLSGSVTPSVMLSSTAGFLLLTVPNRNWLSVSTDFSATVNLLLTVWNTDTGVLIAGRLGTLAGTNWPRPRWLRMASPAKSVEGLLGGFIGGIVTYWSLPFFWILIRRYNLDPLVASRHSILNISKTNDSERLVTGTILSLAAILGDLWESSLKRSFQVKDSGKLLPGHGGVLDRFDSSLLAVVVYHQQLKKR